MVKIYYNLVKKGLKTIDEVPEKIREEVRKLLEGNNWLSNRQTKLESACDCRLAYGDKPPLGGFYNRGTVNLYFYNSY